MPAESLEPNGDPILTNPTTPDLTHLGDCAPHSRIEDVRVTATGTPGYFEIIARGQVTARDLERLARGEPLILTVGGFRLALSATLANR